MEKTDYFQGKITDSLTQTRTTTVNQQSIPKGNTEILKSDSDESDGEISDSSQEEG
jgi:hypothetical protein